MRKQDLNELIEYDNVKFRPKVLINEPGYRMVLLTMRKGQVIPEHSTQGKVTVYAILGHITFHEGASSCDLRSGEVVTVEMGALHVVEAHQDSALLVLATGESNAAASSPEELDLRAVPRPLRHPLVFGRFDALAIRDSFFLINDHDPVPLHRQIEAMRPGQVAWDYVERGPETFRIRIRRIAPAVPAVSVRAEEQGPKQIPAG